MNFSRRIFIRCAAFAFLASLTLICGVGVNEASAQLCQPCAQGTKYQIKVASGFETCLSYATVVVNMQNLSTAVTTQNTHQQLAPGSSTIGNFPSFPNGNYGITTIEITTRRGTILEIYCNPNNSFQCFAQWCDHTWSNVFVKVRFRKPNSTLYPGDDMTACYVIDIESSLTPC